MKYIFSIILICILSIYCFTAFAAWSTLHWTSSRWTTASWGAFIGKVYTSSSTLTFAWNASSGDVDHYEVQAVDILHPQTVVALGSTTNLSITLNKLDNSIWKYRVRACNDNGCSRWADSTNPRDATVGKHHKAWKICWK